jgi:hypothetical protein
VTKGFEENKSKNKPIPYPCHVVNRFECPYEKGKVSNRKFDLEDLFELANVAFAGCLSCGQKRFICCSNKK